MSSPAVKKFILRNGEYVPVIVDDNGNEREAVWAPMPGSQQVFLECDTTEVLYEGTRGGGKTITLLMDYLQDVGKWGPDWTGILFRQSHPMLADVIEQSRKWIGRIYGDHARYNKMNSTWEWDTGEILYLRAFDQDSEYDKYIGHNYQWIGWEELVLWAKPKAYNQMFSNLRTTRPGVPLKVRATTNPWGLGHGWIQKRFNLHNWPRPGVILGDLIEAVDPITGRSEPPRRAIHSDLKENLLMEKIQPKYRDNIVKSCTNDAQRKAWLEGCWDIAAGGMFDDIWGSHSDAIVVPPFEVPLSWRITRAFDWGSSDPFSVGWYAESDGTDLMFPDGKIRSTVRGDLFRIKEWYGWTGSENEGNRMLAVDISRGIVERELQWGWRSQDGKLNRVKAGPADSSIFDEMNGMCIALDFEKRVRVNGINHRGIQWERADKSSGSRELGCEEIRKRLRATKPEAGLSYREAPGLFICSNCLQWLRTVPYLPRDKVHINDVDCWVAGTLVSTPIGSIPIEKVRTGDLVDTPIGPRTVIASYISGPSETAWARLSNGRVIEGTPHHKVYVEGHGLVALSDLTCYMTLKERIIWLEQKLSSIVVSPIGAILDGSITSQISGLSRMVEQACTDRFGLMLEMIFRSVGMSTTKVMTTIITNSEILNACRPESMLAITSSGGNGQWSRLASIGEQQMKGRQFCELTVKRCMKELRAENLRARIVAVLLQLDILDNCIARLPALPLLRFSERLKKFARFVAPNFWLNRTTPRKFEPVHIVAVGHSAVKKATYNLTVADAGLFYANGVLSSNTHAEDHCYDETRYRLRYDARPLRSGRVSGC